MRKYLRWPLMALLVHALAACNLLPTPTPEPPTPTPRARVEQIAQATEVSARITATAAARAVPTTVPTPQPQPTLAVVPGSGANTRPVAAQLQAEPLPDGVRYSDPTGRFAVIVPGDWQPYPVLATMAGGKEEAGVVLSPLPPRESPIGITVVVIALPKAAAVLPLSDVTNALLAQRRDVAGPSYEKIGLDRIQLNGMPVDRHTYQFVAEGERGQTMEAYIVVDNVLYLVMFHGYPDNFAAHQPVFDAILASYTIGK